jgi:hypothetical protein
VLLDFRQECSAAGGAAYSTSRSAEHFTPTASSPGLGLGESTPKIKADRVFATVSQASFSALHWQFEPRATRVDGALARG